MEDWQRYFGKYEKQYYDIRLDDGYIYGHCYPNARTFHTDDSQVIDGKLVTHFRKSEKQFDFSPNGDKR